MMFASLTLDAPQALKPNHVLEQFRRDAESSGMPLAATAASWDDDNYLALYDAGACTLDQAVHGRAVIRRLAAIGVREEAGRIFDHYAMRANFDTSHTSRPDAVPMWDDLTRQDQDRVIGEYIAEGRLWSGEGS